MATRRTRRLPEGVTQLCLFPGDVAIRPARPVQPSRPCCADVGHSWSVCKQYRLFGLPSEDVTYCTTCGLIQH